MVEITRQYSTIAITATSAAATTNQRISFRPFAGGGIMIASTNGATQISWHVADGPETLPRPLFADGAAVTSAVTVGASPIPDAAFAFPYVTPVISGSTSCSITVHLKG
jgi:hypothetical protein